VVTDRASRGRVLIVGASAAGSSVAVQLRRGGYEDEIILAGDELLAPYDRPPLSKQMLLENWTVEQLVLHGAGTLDELGIDLRLGWRAVSLDRSASLVSFTNGESLSFDTLVIATGVHAIRLPIADGIEGVHYLRTVEDSIALRTRLQSPGDLVIVGAGFIGLEAAAAARKAGWSVHVVEAASTPLALKVGERVGRFVQQLHESHGLVFHTSHVAAEFPHEDGRLTGVRLDDGTYLPADVALIGVGTRPNTGWLESSGLQLDGGVLTDEYLRAGTNIYAAGDVACVPQPGTGLHARVEHRTAAADHALVVTQNILGEEAPHTAHPFFWSDQYDLRLQMLGTYNADSDVDEVLVEDGRLVVAFHSDGHLDGVFGCNAAKQLVPLRRALIKGEPYQPASTISQGV
jgi:3-phenylpropionate/trans-cinnamate dioxygenase ferredoxin reductase subunit